MKRDPTSPQRANDGHGFHAGGRNAYRRAARTDEIIHRLEAKLRRRIQHWCHPKTLIGDFVLVRQRWRLVRKIRGHHGKTHALFLSQRLGTFRH